MKNTPPCLILVLCALLSSACANSAETLRPKTITAGDAIGDVFECTEEKLRDDLSPFTVDWPDSDRAALESSMRRGVAVVKMSCEGPKVLKACMVLGDYAYTGVSRKTKLVQMKDQGSVAVNLGAAVSPVFKSALEQGRSLMLAYTIAGAETTTVTSVGPWQLKGRCDGATHFVFETQVGAFAMETAEAGSSSTAADLFVGNASAESSSEKSTRTTDGDPGSCETSSSKDIEKLEGCGALMRVDLMFIDLNAQPPTEPPDPRLDPVVRATSCPEGYAWEGGVCVAEAQAQATLCAKGDVVDCQAQCKLGSEESCDRWAEGLVSEAETAEMAHDEWQDSVVARGEVIDTWAPHVEILQAACENGMPHACAVMGYHHSNKMDETRAMKGFADACINGDSGSCYILSDVEPRPDALLEEGKAVRLPYLETACNKGMAIACGMWSELFLDDWNSYDELEFDPRVGSMAARACYGGKVNYCVTAAAFHASEQTRCVELLEPSAGGDQAKKSCQDKLSAGLTGSDVETSMLLSIACDNGRKFACEFMDSHGLRLDFDKLAEESVE